MTHALVVSQSESKSKSVSLTFHSLAVGECVMWIVKYQMCNIALFLPVCPKKALRNPYLQVWPVNFHAREPAQVQCPNCVRWVHSTGHPVLSLSLLTHFTGKRERENITFAQRQSVVFYVQSVTVCIHFQLRSRETKRMVRNDHFREEREREREREILWQMERERDFCL